MPSLVLRQCRLLALYLHTSSSVSQIIRNPPPRLHHTVRTGWCCQSVDGSIAGWDGSASAPSQASAWCGTTCETVRGVSFSLCILYVRRSCVRTGIVRVSRVVVVVFEVVWDMVKSAVALIFADGVRQA